MAFRIQGFQGEVPRRTPRQLADTQAQALYNFRLTSGRLEPLYYPKSLAVTAKVGDLKSVYRLYDDAGVSYWLSWLEDVDVVRGPIAGDASFRFYFTSESFEPRASNLALATAVGAPYPNQWYALGVTPPVTAPTVVHSAPSGAAETRLYVATLVTQWGEESAPSPASAPVVGTAGGTWTVTVPDVAPANSYTITAVAWAAGELTLTSSTSLFGLRAKEYVTLAGFSPAVLNASFKVKSVTGSAIKIAMPADPGPITDGIGTATRDAPHNTTGLVKRLYRSVTSGSGTAFYLVANTDGSAYEVPAATTTMVDTGKPIGELLPTDDWLMPPADLQGIKLLPSGSLIGFSGNEVCFSEPSAPYAWPSRYRLTCGFPIVGVGVFGTSAVVCTKGIPYLATGTDPETMSMTKVDQQWPCLAKRSIVEMGYGVAWACPLGLAQIGVSGANLLTANFYTEREWAALNPSSLISAYYGGRYYGAYRIDAQNYGVLVLDGQTAEAVITHSDLLLSALWTDPATGVLYVVLDQDIKQWDADTTYRMLGEWWSKEFVVPKPLNYGAARVEGEFFSSAAEEAAYAAQVAAQRALNQLVINATALGGGSLNGASANEYGLNDSEVVPDDLVGDGALRAITLELWVDGLLYFSKTVTQDTTFRLPAGKKYDAFSVRVLGNVPIDSIVIGETSASLEQV